MTMAPVFDSENPERLLGYYDVSAPMCGVGIVVKYLSAKFNSGEFELELHHRSEERRTQIDPLTQEIVQIERQVLHTDAPLELLMESPYFYLPGESSHTRRCREEHAEYPRTVFFDD